MPNSGDVLYFELPAAIGKVQSLSGEVHLYIFDTLPASPFQALSTLSQAKTSIWCKTIGVEDDRGGRESEASWHIDGVRPILRRAPRPFRPRPARDMQQVRVKAYRDVRGDFEYLFERAKPAFEPIFDRTQEVKSEGEIAHRLEALALVPPEHLPWYRVTGLRRREEPDEKEGYRAALKRLSPEAGIYPDVDEAAVERVTDYRAPFLLLQLLHINCAFVSAVAPPLECAMTWSTVKFSQMSGCRQDAQSFLSSPFYKIRRCSEEKILFPSFRSKRQQ